MSDSSSLCEDSDSSREDTSEEFSGFDEEFGLRPYQFEPELEDISVSSSGDESSEGSEKSDENVDDQEDNRLANSNWYVLFLIYEIFHLSSWVLPSSLVHMDCIKAEFPKPYEIFSKKRNIEAHKL